MILIVNRQNCILCFAKVRLQSIVFRKKESEPMNQDTVEILKWLNSNQLWQLRVKTAHNDIIDEIIIYTLDEMKLA